MEKLGLTSMPKTRRCFKLKLTQKQPSPSTKPVIQKGSTNGFFLKSNSRIFL